MPISSVSITEVRPTANSVEADFTAEGLIFTGTATLTGFLEVVDSDFSATVLASSPIEESQGSDTASYTYSVDVADVPGGDYTLRVVWDDESGNSGRDSTTVTIPEQDTGGGGGGDDDLLLSDLTITCSVSTFDAEVGDTVIVEYDIEGFAPPATSYDVDVDLYSNGTYTSTLTEGISPNGAGGGEFEVELPTEGNYDFSTEMSNLRQVE